MKKEICIGRRPQRPVKRIISLILSLIMLSSITAGLDFSAYALASRGSYGENLTWTFDSSSGTLTISGSGAMKGYSQIPGPPFCNETAIKKVVINSGVTTIGALAFYGCSGLKSIIIPNTVTSIEHDAFLRCYGLTSITIPNSIKKIGEHAFSLTFLSSIIIPNSVTDLEESAFSECSRLTSVTIENGLKTIPYNTFYKCTNLMRITVPNSITNIGVQAFGDCTNLEYVYYTGSEEKWNTIKIADGNTDIINTVRYYNYQADSSVRLCNEHNWNNEVIINQPTCGKIGIKKSTCTVCGGIKNESIPATGVHIYNDGFIHTKPNCVKTGLKVFTCTVCGSSKSEIIPATGIHYYNNVTITTQPTCTRTGVKTYKCINCSDSYTETVPAYGHNYVANVTKAATCMESGIKTNTCSRCYNKYTETIPATGNHTYNSGVTSSAPTCIKSGIKTFACSVCGNTKTETIPATGVHSYNNGTITTQPTCTKTGVKKYECINCTNSYTETVPALGHNYTERVTKVATCTESGVKTFTCSRCNNSYTATVKALGHNYKTTVKKATPYDYGYSDSVCSRCGDEHYKCIESPEVSLTQYVYNYDGKTKKPEVIVYRNGEYNSYLSKKNYSIIYPKESKKLGTYTVKIVLKGAYYSGTFEESFRIQPKGVNAKKVKTKPYSKEKISVSWKKVKGVDGYIVYRWNNKKSKYVKYKKTKKTNIKIKRENKKTNQVDFAIATYKKQGKKTYESDLVCNYNWVKLSAPTYKIEQNNIKEFTMVFPYKDFYYIQWSNNPSFTVDDKDRNKNYWVNTGVYADKGNNPDKKESRIRVYNLKANQTVYVRARKVYYNKKGKLVLGPWSKAKKVTVY